MSKFTTIEQRASYGIGVNIGQQLANDPFEGLDLDAVAAGLKVAFGGQPEVSEDEINQAFAALNEKLQASREAQFAQQKDLGIAFLADNAKREGVVVTESGLQYEVLTAGDGEKPLVTDTVSCHYHGTLVDGTVFDSSVERGQPAEFPLNRVIKGWTEVLQLMPVGSKWRVYIPQELAYGAQGAGQSIAPYSALIFDIELLAVV